MLNAKNWAGSPDAGMWLQAADARTALANKVTGHETQAQLAAIQAEEKRLSLLAEQGKMEYDAQSAHFDQANAMFQKDSEQHQRLFEMGALFG